MDKVRAALVAGAIAVSAPAIAQDQPQQPIVVTGRGLADTAGTPAYAATVLPRETLVSVPSGRIEDALGNIAGFQQFRRSDSRSSNPSAQGVTLRALGGNAASRSLVLLDGVPQADPFFGYIAFSALDPGALARVRVTRGGGSGAFGAGAVAGTIELESAGREVLGAVAGSALVDDRGETEVSARIAPRLGSGYVVAAGRWDRGAGFWTTPIAQRVPASVRARYDSWNGSLRGVAPLGAGLELQARVAVFDDRRTLRFAGAGSRSRGEEASLRVVGGGRWKIDAIGYVQARDFSNVVISSTRFTRTLDQRATPSTGVGGKIELRPPVGAGHTLRVGADGRSGTGKLGEDAYNAVTGAVTARRSAGGTNRDFGAYLEDDWQHGAVTLTGGVRLDAWKIAGGFFNERSAAGLTTIDLHFAGRSGTALSLRGGAVVALGGGLAFRAAAYSGLRVPTLNELYRPFVVFPVTTLANAALTNEELRGAEAGIDFAPGRGLDLAVTVFDNRLNHAVANVTIAPNLRQRQNVDAIDARGLEASGRIRRGIAALSASLALTDAAVRAHGAAAALNGLRPAQTPRIAASATFSLDPAPGTTFALTMRHVGAQFEDDLQIDTLPAATTLGLFASVAIRAGVGLILRGENLTNRQIVTRDQAGSIDLGAPRTLWIGVRFGG